LFCLINLGIAFARWDYIKESKGLGNIEKVICLCLLATFTQTSSLHGIDSTAQELVGVCLLAKLEMFSDS